MQPARARFLVSAEGRAALAAFADLDASDPVRLAARLRVHLAPADAAAIAEQLALRSRATGRIDDARNMLLTAEGLEMMTHPVVAARRAARFAAARVPAIVDGTCGLGGDLRFLAGAAPRTLGIERDAATAILARANVPRSAIVCGDATHLPVAEASVGLFLDPSRRYDGTRRFDPGAFSPPLDVCIELSRAAASVAAIKLAPGLASAAIPAEAEVEFVQLGRSLREATLWFGLDSRPGLRRAVLLPAGAELDSSAPEAPAVPVASAPFLVDPESCVTRAGLVRHLAARMEARLLDPAIAYLGADVPRIDPLAATFEVLDRVEFSLARLRRRLRECRWLPIEIRRRAFPVEPDELRRLLGRLEGDPVTLICTTIGGKRTVFVARRLHKANCASV